MILRIAVAVASLYAFAAVRASSDQVVLGPSNTNPPEFVRPERKLPTLADLLTLENKASIFYSYSREVDIGARFTEGVSEGEGITVFVPTNKAVQALTRKPNQDPRLDRADILDSEYESISRSNVRRWVGAHIIPHPNVDFTYSEPYDTLTPGVTISFNVINAGGSTPPAGEPHIDVPAGRPLDVKEPADMPTVDMDTAHFASVKSSHSASGDAQKHSHPLVNTDSAYFSTIKGALASQDSAVKICMAFAASGEVDTDATHFSTIKGFASPDLPPRTGSVVEGPSGPPWERCELNGAIHIISKRPASNGVLYLIDGTVSV